MVEEAVIDPIRGEARLRIQGGFAHFPGTAREQILRFCDLPAAARDMLVIDAQKAGFFELTNKQGSSRPDARTYVLCLTIGDRSHEVRIAEPIHDPALAKLISTIRKLLKPVGRSPRVQKHDRAGYDQPE